MFGTGCVVLGELGAARPGSEGAWGGFTPFLRLLPAQSSLPCPPRDPSTPPK